MTGEQRYRIKTVAEMTGIPRNTLLAWERRHGILSPERLSNGYRLYSDDDVRLLRRLKAEVDGGVAISQALESLRRGAVRDASPVDPTSARDELFDHLTRFDRAAADRVVAGLASVPYASLIDDIHIPLMRRIGDEWAAGRVDVAQEHFAAAFVREQLVSMLLRLGAQPHRGSHVACVTFPGDRHELALLALTVHLVLRGCRVTYLGADVPEPDLVDFLDRVRPDCLCVSVIVGVEPDHLASFARAVRRAAPAAARIIIGGAGLPGRAKAVKGVELLGNWRELDLA